MAGPEKERIKCLSFLLQFPDSELIADVGAYRARIEELFDLPESCMVGKLLRYFLKSPLLELQEGFSAVFDLDPCTCLNLTYHQYGDDRKRGEALARYAQAYQDEGFALIRPELPDYLPMVLELLAQSRNGGCWWMLSENRHVIARLAERLEEKESPYRGIFRILAQMSAAFSGDTAGGM
jgi:nitrate reductase delta subunit